MYVRVSWCIIVRSVITCTRTTVLPAKQYSPLLTMLARSLASRAIVRSGKPRCMSTVPRMHKAKDFWPQLKEQTRPHGHHEHLVFELPYDPPVAVGMIAGICIIGYGSIAFGLRHQQYKQGYWK